MALIAAHLNAEVILVVTVQREVYNLPLPPPPPHLHTPPPISPSLKSRMVSVDVKHHVSLPTLSLRFRDWVREYKINKCISDTDEKLVYYISVWVYVYEWLSEILFNYIVCIYVLCCNFMQSLGKFLCQTHWQ